MVVERVHLPECRAHLADLRQQAARELGKCQEALFEVDALFSERDEEVGARVRIDHRLKSGLRFVHLERRSRTHRVPAGSAEEVADDGHVRIEDLRAADRPAGRAVDGQRAARAAGALRARRHLCRRRLTGRRLRPRRRGRRAFRGGQLRLERGQPIAVLLLQRVEVLTQLIDFLP